VKERKWEIKEEIIFFFLLSFALYLSVYSVRSISKSSSQKQSLKLAAYKLANIVAKKNEYLP
jgi:membrane protein implicated in regulation of membrane protease activity